MSQCFICVLAITSLSQPLHAENEPARSGATPVIEWSTVDAGGGFASAPGIAIEGTIGQADADALQASVGSGYELSGGYWPGLSHAPDPLFKDGFEESR